MPTPVLPRRQLGHVPTASTTQFLLWLARLQWRSLTVGVITGVVWMLAQALLPYALGRAVDEGVEASSAGSVRPGLLRPALPLVARPAGRRRPVVGAALS